jgi:hypothetical protein
VLKQKLVFFIFILCLAPLAHAGYFLGVVGSHLNLEYKSVRTGTVEAETKGYVELAGFTGGYTTMAPGNFGYEFGLGFLGTNAQNLEPKPDWRTTWYYRVTTKGFYTFSFGLFFTLGADVLVSFYQDGESHYLGIGALLGLGYRINERAYVSLSNVNSSILFAGDNYRTLRGQVLDLTYTF